MRKSRQLVFLYLSLGISSAQGALVSLEELAVDDTNGAPVGALSSTVWVETNQTHTTSIASAVFNNYSFTFWSNDAHPLDDYRDLWGRSENPISFILLEDTVATAHYLPTTLDTDSDTVPDWFEIEYYGDLDEADSSDTDGDTITLINEYSGGTHPLYPDSRSDGGMSWNDSSLVTVNLAGYAGYTITSIPSGKVDTAAIIRPNVVVTSPDFRSDATFGYWLLDGIRQEDAWGAAFSQINFTIENTDRSAVAHFFTGSTESPADSIPDAYEYYYYGTTTYGDDSDTDGDGFSLLEEYNNGTLPHFANSETEGGISWVDSNLITINFADFSRYTLSSNPAGSIDETGIVADGTTVTTNEETTPNFAYWTLDGIRQEDAWGVALRQIEFLMDGADRNAIATFIDGDSDLDGVDDAFEYYYYDTLANDAASDTDSDGQTLLDEFNAGTHPRYANQRAAGGIFWEDSELLTANLQPFERLSKVLVDGVLTDFFSSNPNTPSGIDVGNNASTAAADWDGDGDFELFVAHDDGLRIFENVGTPTNPNFSEVSGLSSVSSIIADLSNPIIAGGDWNNDDKTDLVIGGASGTLQLIPSNGNFTAANTVQYLATDSVITIPSLGDFNDDNIDDLIVLLADGSVRLYLNTNSTPAFSTFTNNFLGQPIINGTGLSAGDINQDGRIDVLASDSDGRIWEFHQNEDGSFTLISKVWGGSYPGFASGLNLAAVDLEQDGDLDLVAGLANGSILGLRDPRAGPPTGLLAIPGADSILLQWNASWQSRIAGYSIYRSDLVAGPFNNLVDEPYPLPSYRDTGLAPGNPYHYYLTSVSRFFLPGNSEPRIVESLPSDTISANAGEVTISIRSVRGQPNNRVRVPIAIDNSLGLSAAGLFIQVRYDESVIIPIVQYNPSGESVRQTGLTQDANITDNGTTANGTLTINGTSGQIRAGAGNLFILNFRALNSAALGLRTTINITSASMNARSGLPVTVHIKGSADLEIADNFILGDLDGDGSLSDADESLLKELTKPKSRAPTDAELLAGDLNGDGELNQQDVVLLKRLLKDLPIE